MKEITKEWLSYAVNDLNAANDLFIDIHKHAQTITFHLQQSIEKYIKAYIQETSKEDPPKIHDLVALMETAALPIELNVRRFLEELTYIYIESRYPTSIKELEELLTKDKVEQLHNNAKEFVEWIKTKF